MLMLTLIPKWTTNQKAEKEKKKNFIIFSRILDALNLWTELWMKGGAYQKFIWFSAFYFLFRKISIWHIHYRMRIHAKQGKKVKKKNSQQNVIFVIGRHMIRKCEMWNKNGCIGFGLLNDSVKHAIFIFLPLSLRKFQEDEWNGRKYKMWAVWWRWRWSEKSRQETSMYNDLFS